MSNKYYDTMSKIKADESFKEKLISNLAQEVNTEKNINMTKNKLRFVKLKRIIMGIISTLTMLFGSGAVYAALGGTINGVPVLEWMGIKFSDNYVEYIEPVENQIIENEDAKITLESTVCDDGFTILQFRVNISEDKLNSYKTEEDIESNWEVPFCYLSFNDPVIVENGYKYTELGGANYNLIIDEEEVWVRGRSVQSIDKISENEYLVYQMWFLDENMLKQKKEFEITLKDTVIGLGEDCIEVNGEFNVEVSKGKALENTKTITPNDNTVKYKKMEKSIEKISITPLQTIIKVRNVYKNIEPDDLVYVLDEDYVGQIDYIAFDQNQNKISSHTIQTEEKIIYEDGRIQELIPGEGWDIDDSIKNATFETVEMIAVEQNDFIKEIDLKAYETIDYYETVRNVMEYKINLDKNEIKSSNKDVLIYSPQDSIVTEEYKVFYKNFYGMDYEIPVEYNDMNYEYVEEVEGYYDPSEYEALTYIDNYESVELEVIDETHTDEIFYTEPLKITDENMINQIIDVIKNSTEYPEFKEVYGEGGYFEGTPILTIYLKDGRKMTISTIDKFDIQDDIPINIMYIAVIDENYNKYNTVTYLTNTNFEEILEKMYDECK